MKFWTKSLMSRLVVYFLLLSVITVFSVGAIAFAQARASIESLVFERLEVTATLKEETLGLWLENQLDATLSLAELPGIPDKTYWVDREAVPQPTPLLAPVRKMAGEVGMSF